MKTYIGIKKIEAEPMNRGDYNKYRGWTIPEDENPADDGYLVKYTDGYESWSPKHQFDEAYSEIGVNPLVDTALLLKSSDFKDRFKAEYWQTKIRYDKLHQMIVKYDAGTLNFEPKCSIGIFKDQARAMNNYLYTLEIRAQIEGIVL